MDFLANIGIPGTEFTTGIGSLIEKATSESLVNTDWALNMQICDEINHQGDGPSHAAKALKRRLKSDNPKILELTLTLCETTMKNCSRPLHRAVGSREFLAEVAGLCSGQKGYEVRSRALGLIQDWGIAFQSDRSLAYSETYGRLKAQGARFPEATDAATTAFTPAAASYGASSSSSTAMAGSGGGGGGGSGGGGGGGVRSAAEAPPQTMEKLEEDLQMVKDKITLCREMLPESAGVDKDPALSEVVGFLEACRPRMVDLVEAGVGGALGEDTFAKCLQINDALLRTLDAEREGTPIAVEDDTSGGAAPLLDLDGGSEDPLKGKMSTFSIGDDGDDFAELRRGNPPAAVGKGARGSVTKLGAVPLKTPAAEPPKATPAGDDDLDDFLNSLTDDAGPAIVAAGAADDKLDVEELDKVLG
ncbi:unnamed protein product [Ectocarpus sp. 12 AP-2014]